MTIAAALARLVTDISGDDLPPLALDHAAMLISSTIASAALGHAIASSRIVRELVQEQGGTPEASIWFDVGPKVPVVSAARVNALASDAAASDDSDLRGIIHTGTTVASSSLALAERSGANGKDVLAAMVLGYEAAGRINDVVTPGWKQLGWHGSVVAIFGAAVAGGRLLSLTEQQMTHAISMAAVSMGGLAVSADTSLAREYFAGNAAMLGVNAALMAHKGYTVEDSVLEAKKGYFELHGGVDYDAAVRDFGREWDIITDAAIKLVPGGHPNHALAEAAANAAREGNVTPGEVESIIMAQPVGGKLGIKPLGPPKHPKDLISMAHYTAYFVAAAVADRDFSWVHATDAKILDPVIHALIDRIRIGPPITEDPERYKQGGQVTIVTKDGRRYTSTVYAPRGSGPRGIEWADVDAKYRMLVLKAGLDAARVEQSLKVIHAFGGVGNVAALTKLLR
jgi:2-methylcitrate dehydratase PrpD